MQILEEPKKMQELAISLRSDGKRVALVATSGALHAGHSSLIDCARDSADVVIVSAIVNPIEFPVDIVSIPKSSAILFNNETCLRLPIPMFDPSMATFS